MRSSTASSWLIFRYSEMANLSVNTDTAQKAAQRRSPLRWASTGKTEQGIDEHLFDWWVGVLFLPLCRTWLDVPATSRRRPSRHGKGL